MKFSKLRIKVEHVTTHDRILDIPVVRGTDYPIKMSKLVSKTVEMMNK